IRPSPAVRIHERTHQRVMLPGIAAIGVEFMGEQRRRQAGGNQGGDRKLPEQHVSTPQRRAVSSTAVRKPQRRGLREAAISGGTGGCEISDPVIASQRVARPVTGSREATPWLLDIFR